MMDSVIEFCERNQGMRDLAIAVVTSLALTLAACTGDDDDASTDGLGGDASSAGDTSTGGTSGSGGSGSGGSTGTGQVEFEDLPGKIRFINFVSDGVAGMNLDLYWGVSIQQSELVGTVAYGEITEFMTPRRQIDSILDADEARFFMVPEGDVSGNPSTFLVQQDPNFAEDVVLTIGLSVADSPAEALAVSVGVFYEAELSTPPAGMAHVFAWSRAFDQIADGDFVLVGADGVCNPERGDSGGVNLGAPALIPEGATGLSLFDANTEPPCDSGLPPVAATVAAGHSYVLLGEAETYEIDARRAVLLELGTQN
jgi:hypothetical protein